MGRVVKVICHSGYTYAERPTAIEMDGSSLEIDEILSQAITPKGRFFKVKMSDGRILDLEYDESRDEWQITNEEG